MISKVLIFRFALVALAILSLLLVACGSVDNTAAGSGSSGGKPALKISGIPDQNTARLARRYQGLTEYLSEELGVEVKFVPSVNYAAVVTSFSQGGLQLAFFGGFTRLGFCAS